MARFSQVAKGASARHTETLTLLDGTEWRVDVVPLIGEMEADSLVGARAYAKAHGIEEPRPGQELYELGLWAHTLLVACLDADENGDVRAFDSIEQILDRKNGLDRDRIAFLFEAQQRHQDACSFRKRGLDAVEYINAVVAHAVAEEDAAELPFEQWAPATRRSFVRTLCVQYTNLVGLKSLSGSDLQGEAKKPATSSETSSEADPTPRTA